ncbi:THUMP domain-containing protein 1 [Colossoma macropomum]|uniref:THUMP domain-containing protein 1 n=1 Tax=Colossoma macropomum TaxID=42526 RepID=UPI001863FFC3|nr:THUMP domain-containing protein 1 [Colossoma macropomum]
MSEDSRKRSWRVRAHGAKRPRQDRALSAGMQGVLITCNMNARRCTAEAYSLLGEYGEKLYGPEQLGDPDGSDSDEAEDEDDVEAALKKEVTQIQSSSKKRERRFQAVDSGANNVVFIRTHDVDPEKLVHHILQDLHQTKKKKSRVILRMLPVSGTCRAFPEDMEKYLSSYLEPWFKAPNRASFQINFKARNSSHNKREEVIKSLAGLVAKLNPENKVDLTNPELTIIVEIIKSVCCVSVVRDYMLFRKYNLQEVSKASTNQEQGKREAAQGEADPEQNEVEPEKNKAELEQNQAGPEQNEVESKEVKEGGTDGETEGGVKETEEAERE